MNVERTPLYTFARFMMKIVLCLFFGAKAYGVENFPKDQNCILMSNHISAWDPLTVAYFYPYNEVHFIAKESLFRVPVVGWVIAKLHAFPVHRGETDMTAMRTSMQVLRDGHVLGIFPEGTRRHGVLKSIETGVAVMALRSDVPVVPVFISGKYRPFGKLRCVVGKPVELSDLRAQRADAQTLEEIKVRLLNALEALERMSPGL